MLTIEFETVGMEFESLGPEEEEIVREPELNPQAEQFLVSPYIITAGVAFLFLLGALIFASAHYVERGHFGIYSRNGAVLEAVSEPGLNFMLPLFTNFEQVQSSPRVHQVKNITCITVGGVDLLFEKIEVKTRLHKNGVTELVRAFGLDYEDAYIHDNIRHEIENFCGERTLHQVYIEDLQKIRDWITWGMKTGDNFYLSTDPSVVEIMAVVVHKPKLPEAVAQAYARWEVEDAEIKLEEIRSLNSKDKESIELMEAELRGKRATADAVANEILFQSKAAQAKVLAESYYYEQKLRAEAELKVAEIAYTEEQLRVYREGLKAKSRNDLAMARLQSWALESFRILSALCLGGAILFCLTWFSERNQMNFKAADIKLSYG